MLQNDEQESEFVTWNEDPQRNETEGSAQSRDNGLRRASSAAHSNHSDWSDESPAIDDNVLPVSEARGDSQRTQDAAPNPNRDVTELALPLLPEPTADGTTRAPSRVRRRQSFWQRLQSCCCCGLRRRSNSRRDQSSDSSEFRSDAENEDSTRQTASNTPPVTVHSKKTATATDRAHLASKPLGDSGYDIMSPANAYKVCITDVVADAISKRDSESLLPDRVARHLRRDLTNKYAEKLQQYSISKLEVKNKREPMPTTNAADTPSKGGDAGKPATPKPAAVFVTRSSPRTYSLSTLEECKCFVPSVIFKYIPHAQRVTTIKEGRTPEEENSRRYAYLASPFKSKDDFSVFSCPNATWLTCKRAKEFKRGWKCSVSSPTRLTDLSFLDSGHPVLSKIALHRGSVQELGTVAIVNAANRRCLGGGGVDGAIHEAAGPLLLRDCCSFDGCAVGHTRLTKGYCLPAKFILHTVAPQDQSRSALRSCYITCLDLCRLNGITSVGFCAIGTGIYNYPLDGATEVAISTVAEYVALYPGDFTAVVFACFREEEYAAYAKRVRPIVNDVIQALADTTRLPPPAASALTDNRTNSSKSKSKRRISATSVPLSESVLRRANDSRGGGLSFASNGASSAGSPNHSSKGDDNSAPEDASTPEGDGVEGGNVLLMSSSKSRRPSDPAQQVNGHNERNVENARPRTRSMASALAGFLSTSRSHQRESRASSSSTMPNSPTAATQHPHRGKASSSVSHHPTLQVPEIFKYSAEEDGFDMSASMGLKPSLSREVSTEEAASKTQKQKQQETKTLERLWKSVISGENDGENIKSELGENGDDGDDWNPITPEQDLDLKESEAVIPREIYVDQRRRERDAWQRSPAAKRDTTNGNVDAELNSFSSSADD